MELLKINLELTSDEADLLDEALRLWKDNGDWQSNELKALWAKVDKAVFESGRRRIGDPKYN